MERPEARRTADETTLMADALGTDSVLAMAEAAELKIKMATRRAERLYDDVTVMRAVAAADASAPLPAGRLPTGRAAPRAAVRVSRPACRTASPT